MKDGCFLAASKPARQSVSEASQSAGPLPAGFSVSWPTASQAASQLASTQASQRPPSQPAGRPASQQPVSSQSASQPARRSAGQPAASQQPVSQQDQQALINLPRWFASCRRGGGECNSQGMDADFISFLNFCVENHTFFCIFCILGVPGWRGLVVGVGQLTAWESPKMQKMQKMLVLQTTNAEKS